MITPLQLASFKAEYSRRIQVWEDCQRIVKETNDIDVLQRRCVAAIDFFTWLHKHIEAGIPIKVNLTLDETREDVAKVFNNNAVRIAKYIAQKADTPRKAKNAISKLELVKSLLWEVENRGDTESSINVLIFNLNIDANG